jgi:hypothetical protein
MDAITQSLPHNLWLILSPILCSQIFQVTQAFLLLSVQFSYAFKLSYLGSTSVNYHFHLSNAQYNITELTVRRKYLKKTKHTCSIPSVHYHDHWNKLPHPTNDTDHKALKKKVLFDHIICRPSQTHPLRRCRKMSKAYFTRFCIYVKRSCARIIHKPDKREFTVVTFLGGVVSTAVILKGTSFDTLTTLFLVATWHELNSDFIGFS